jgi:hypothetical protein
MAREETSPSARLVPLVAALVGAVAGSIMGLMTAGHVESDKQAAVRTSEALADHLAAAWGGATDTLQYTRALTRLAVYAPPDALEAVHAYNTTQCAAEGDKTRECRASWARVVNAFRSANNAQPLPEDLVIEVFWGKQ